MAAKIKGLTLEIDGNTVGLEKGLAKLNKPINAIKNELKDVTRLLKLDPGNTELLAQKQQLLSKQIAESKDKLVALQQAKQQADADMKSGTEVNQEEYRKLCREIEATKQNIDSLTDAYNKSNTAAQKLAAVGDKMQKVGNGISAVGKAVAPVSAAVAGVGGVGLKLAADFEDAFAKVSTLLDASSADFEAYKADIMTASNETGVSVNDFSEAVYSAISLGKTTVDELASSMGKVIPVAAAANYDMTELSSAYALLTKNGIATAESGTYLKSMLNELTKSGSITDTTQASTR